MGFSVHGVTEDSISMADEFRIETRLADFDYKLRADTGVYFVKYDFSSRA